MALIQISQGSIQGGKTTTDSGVSYYEFLGVPFAKPPVGNLRFKSPVPPEKWNGVLDATAYNENKVCAQMTAEARFIGSEDCLYLNVYTPKLPEPDSKLLPVMVFIHGGGFISGNGINNEELGPQYLIDKNVVVVTLNYRLGVLGFLCLDIPEASGNMGVKDQVQGLKWVQQNIDKFGGDPHNVTLFGMSAGSVCVECHLVSPLSEGLFHKAILQSGSSLSSWSINHEPFKSVLKLLKKMDYDGSTEDKQAICEYLASSPINNLLMKAGEVIYETISATGNFEFIPTIEKNFGDGNAMFTEYPYKLLRDGRFNHVPTIMGVCEKEGYFLQAIKPEAFRDMIKNKNFADYLPYELEKGHKDMMNKSLLSFYSKNINKDDDDDKIAVDFFGDLDFVAGSFLRGDLVARKGVPVYFYEFCYDGNNNYCKNFFKIKRKGATHGDDGTYIFKHNVMSKPADVKDASVRETVTKLWTNFAKSSDPNSKDLSVNWPSYNTSKCCLIIDENPGIQSNYLSKRMDVFRKMYERFEKKKGNTNT